MTTIQSAKRNGKEIVISLDQTAEEKGEKIRVMLVGPGGATATKPLRSPKQTKCAFQFGSGKEANLYNEAYLEGLEVDKKHVSIVDKAPAKEVLAAFLQKVRMPKAWRKRAAAGLAFLGCLFLWQLCSSSASRPQVQNLTAYFVSLHSIQVQGEIRFPDTVLHSQKEKILQCLSLELWTQEKREAVEPTSEEIFYKNFAYEKKPQPQRYEIRLVLDGTILHKTPVEDHPSFPLLEIQTASWEGPGVRVTLPPIPDGATDLYLELIPQTKEGKKGSVVAQCAVSTSKTNAFLLGPIREYHPAFWVLLRSAGQILSEKEIACTTATGQMDRARIEEPGNLEIEGRWQGPNGASIELEIWDLERRFAAHRSLVPAHFSVRIPLEDSKSRYEARLKQESQTLDTKEVILSEMVENYTLAREQMPAFMKGLDGVLSMPLREGIEKIEGLQASAHRQEERLQEMLYVWDNASLKKTVLEMRSFYSHLGNLISVVLGQKERAISQEKPHLLAVALEQEKEVSFLVQALQKSLAEVHPRMKEKPLLSLVPEALQKNETEVRYQNLIQYITQATQSEDLPLALRMCDIALSEFPDSWHFLLARYNLYLLSHRKLYLEIYAEKAQADYKALVSCLTRRFEELYKKNQKAQAYVLGSQLSALDESLKSVAHKVESLRASVPLSEKMQALLSIQNFRFPFVVQKNRKGEKE